LVLERFMVLEGRFSCGGYGRVFVAVFAIIILLSRGYVLIAGQQKDTIELNRYRVFTLKNISAQQGKNILADANVGTVSQLPGSNTLLVTAQPVELIKASAILRLVDSKEEFVIKKLCAASEASNLPPKEKIASEAGDILIGTFMDQPIGEAKSKAIIDVHNGSVVVIAEAGRVEQIISAIERLKEAKSKASQGAESPRPAEVNQPLAAPKQVEQTPIDANKPITKTVSEAKPQASEEKASAGDSESDKLLGLLDKAEKTAASTAGKQPKSAEPNAAAPAPEQKTADEPVVAAEEPAAPAEKPQMPVEAAEVNKVPEKVEAAPKVEAVKPKTEAAAEAAEANAAPSPAVGKPYQPEAITGTDETLQLDLPEKLNIIDLLDLVGKYLHLDYVYDAAEVVGKEVSLRIQGPIKVKELYPLMESVLKFKGFVTSRRGNLVTITTKEKALEIDPALISAPDERIRFGDVIISRVYDLKYMLTGDAKSLLDGMKIGVVVTAVPGSKKIIITGYANTMSRVDELLGIFDKPGELKQFKYRQLKYTMAKSLVDQIKKLVEKMGGIVSLGAISTTESAPSPPPGRPVRQVPPPSQASQPSGTSAPALSVYLDFDERTNRILMIGLKGELDIVEDLINVLDVAQQDLRSLRLYEIQYIGAEEVREKLAELGIISGGGAGAGGRISRKGGAQQGAQPQPQPQQGGGGTEGLTEEPQVIVIESTNSLLVNATPEQHAQVAMIIGFTDSETLEHSIPYEIYSLENQDPVKLAEVLNKLIQETVKDKEGKIEKVVKKEDDIIIVPDENTFSIIVYASRKNQEWIKKLIKSLDKRRPQVLLDATLVAVTRGDEFNFDLDMVTKFPKLAPGGSMSVLSALLQDANSGFPQKSVTEVTTGVPSGGTAMQGKGFYSDQHIQALLTVMQSKDYGRILAQPKILVNDNETGTIKAERTTYVTRTTSILPSTTGTTLPTQFAQASTTFEAYPSGITLEITPHISEGDLLRLEISLVRSSQKSAGQLIDQPPPDKEENNIKTIVTVPDQSTIILGGVLTLDQSKGGSKVPILGDIPLIGGLFRSVANVDSESKLYIFVKAYILRPGDTGGLPELVKESKNYRDAFEKSERRFQEYEDWPGIKPTPMEPNRILDAK